MSYQKSMFDFFNNKGTNKDNDSNPKQKQVEESKVPTNDAKKSKD
jgi:hypothetical protein